MIILDTNVISELLKEEPDSSVSNWANSVAMDDLWITTVTIFEIAYGLGIMDAGKRRTRLINAFQQTLDDDFKYRVLPFDHDAALEAANIAANLQKKGKRQSSGDIQIAGIASRFNATLATRNTKHFKEAGVVLVNPWNPSR